jgi:uncharacterized membrane protein
MTKTEKKIELPNRYIYAFMLVCCIVFILLKDLNTALVFGGLALAFDPFNVSVAFQQRPSWQKVWLIVHCAGVFTLIAFSLR